MDAVWRTREAFRLGLIDHKNADYILGVPEELQLILFPSYVTSLLLVGSTARPTGLTLLRITYTVAAILRKAGSPNGRIFLRDA